MAASSDSAINVSSTMPQRISVSTLTVLPVAIAEDAPRSVASPYSMAMSLAAYGADDG